MPGRQGNPGIPGLDGENGILGPQGIRGSPGLPALRYSKQHSMIQGFLKTVVCYLDVYMRFKYSTWHSQQPVTGPYTIQFLSPHFISP